MVKLGEMVDISTQHTPLLQMAKTGWYKWLDKVSNKQHSIPNTTSTCAQHPTRTPTLAPPTPHHAQPGHETSHVRALETQTQKQKQVHTHAHHPSMGTILCAERWCCLSSLLGYWGQSWTGHHSDRVYQHAGTHFADLRRMTG